MDSRLTKSAIDWAPRFAARSAYKKRVRLNVISHLLKQVRSENVAVKMVSLSKWRINRQSADYRFKYVPE